MARQRQPGGVAARVRADRRIRQHARDLRGRRFLPEASPRAATRSSSDDRLRSVHLGDPRTLRALFFGELWRGRDNLKVSLRGPLSLRGLPSLAHPARRTLLLLTAVIGGLVTPEPRGLQICRVRRPARSSPLTLVRLIRMLTQMREFDPLTIPGRFWSPSSTKSPARWRWSSGLRYRVRQQASLAGAHSGGAPLVSAPIRILELRSVRGTGGGPEKTILLGAAQADAGRIRKSPSATSATCATRCSASMRAPRALGIDYVEIRERHSFDPSVWPALRRLVRERAIDIVHAHDYKTNLLAWLLHRWDGVRVLATAHGWTGHSLTRAALLLPGRQAAARAISARRRGVERYQDELMRARRRARARRPSSSTASIIDAFHRDGARRARPHGTLGLRAWRHRHRRGRPARTAEAIRPAARGLRAACASRCTRRCGW